MKDRTIYFDFLRIFATFAVIVIHVAAQNWYTTDINSIEWNVFNFYDSIVRWGVPIFIMISGALFLNKKQPIKKIYKKYILRIITAFTFWSAIYTLLFSRTPEIKTTILNFINGHYHMWFLFMIVGLYMTTPLIKEIIKNQNTMKYFMILGIIFAIIIPQIISLISINSIELGDFLKQFIDKINLQMFLGYTVYYILGYYLDKIDINTKMFKWISTLGIFGFIATIIFSIFISRYTQKPTSLFYNNFTINVLLEAIFMFVLFKKCINKPNLNIKVQNIIYKISKCCFGIYLAHVFVINYLDRFFNLNTLSFNPIFSVPIISIIVFIISFIISFVINHVPILKKYIV